MSCWGEADTCLDGTRTQEEHACVHGCMHLHACPYPAASPPIKVRQMCLRSSATSADARSSQPHHR
eukprot:357381-Chlamydomonas_euryale.AAC.6